MLIAVFTATSKWAGQRVFFEFGEFVIGDDREGVSAKRLLAYDREGWLEWADEGASSRVRARAQSGADSMRLVLMAQGLSDELWETAAMAFGVQKLNCLALEQAGGEKMRRRDKKAISKASWILWDKVVHTILIIRKAQSELLERGVAWRTMLDQFPDLEAAYRHDRRLIEEAQSYQSCYAIAMFDMGYAGGSTAPKPPNRPDGLSLPRVTEAKYEYPKAGGKYESRYESPKARRIRLEEEKRYGKNYGKML